MIDITGKPQVYREAIARGSIKLRGETIEAIKAGKVKKGDVFTVAKVAAVHAVKDTPRIIPYCHPIPITAVDVDFAVEGDRVVVEVAVRTTSQTGVEMEALTGVSAALLTIWDMVKYLEKDGSGNYPTTRIENVMVVRKVKGEG